jgi:hypothetical protein
MADISAARRYWAAHHTHVDILAMRNGVQLRMAGRTISLGKAGHVIQAHADAIGRGEPTVSPASKRFRPTG